jgi:hypothetical protein
MKYIKKLLLFISLGSSFGLFATDLFMLNKTGKDLYYDLYYHPLWKGLGRPKKKSGMLRPNQVLHKAAYRLISLSLRDKPDSPSLVTSLDGDTRIWHECKYYKLKDCLSKTLSLLSASITREGSILINQNLFYKVALPVVIVVSLDPGRERRGKIGYIITELGHTMGLIRRPKKFFFEVQKMPTPSVFTPKKKESK